MGRIVALRAGKVIADAPPSALDARAIEQIYARSGEAAATEERSTMPEASPPVDEEWNAGDLGCGELVLELRERLGRMRLGQIIKVTARDPGAPADMPAWCRLTGHTLVHMEHPVYLIRRDRPHEHGG